MLEYDAKVHAISARARAEISITEFCSPQNTSVLRRNATPVFRERHNYKAAGGEKALKPIMAINSLYSARDSPSPARNRRQGAPAAMILYSAKQDASLIS